MRQGNIIGERIRLLRELRGWTQRQFAQKLRNTGHSVSRDVVARWETRETPVNDIRMLGIATLLRISVVDPVSAQTSRTTPNKITCQDFL